MSKKFQEPSVKKSAFVHKLYSMLSNPALSHLIWWTDNNESNTFALNPGKEFANSLTGYFKHGNVASFVRQLHMYGFHKVSDPNQTSINSTSDDDNQPIWEFKHSSGKFKKDDESSLIYIKRRSSSNTSKGSFSNNERMSQSGDSMYVPTSTPSPNSFEYKSQAHYYPQHYVNSPYYHPQVTQTSGPIPSRIGQPGVPIPYQPQVYGYSSNPYEHIHIQSHMGMPPSSQQIPPVAHMVPNGQLIQKNGVPMIPAEQNQGYAPQAMNQIPHLPTAPPTHIPPTHIPPTHVPPTHIPTTRMPPTHTPHTPHNLHCPPSEIQRPYSTSASIGLQEEEKYATIQTPEAGSATPDVKHPQYYNPDLKFKKVWQTDNQATKPRNPSLLYDPLAPTPIPVTMQHPNLIPLRQAASPHGNSSSAVPKDSDLRSSTKLPPPSSIHLSSSLPGRNSISPDLNEVSKFPRSIPGNLEKSPVKLVTTNSIPGSPNTNKKPQFYPPSHSVLERLRPSLIELYGSDKINTSNAQNSSIGSQSSENSIFSVNSSISSTGSLKRTSSFGSITQSTGKYYHKHSINIGPRDPIPSSNSTESPSSTASPFPDSMSALPSKFTSKTTHLHSPRPSSSLQVSDEINILSNLRSKSSSPLCKEISNENSNKKLKDTTNNGKDSIHKVSINSMLDSESKEIEETHIHDPRRQNNEISVESDFKRQKSN